VVSVDICGVFNSIDDAKATEEGPRRLLSSAVPEAVLTSSLIITRFLNGRPGVCVANSGLASKYYVIP
jgi:hypothetical protein